MINCSQISHSFFQGSEKIEILKNINFSFEQGVTYSITGSSGSGKSTFLNILAGLLKPFAGQVFVAEKDLYQLLDAERAYWRLRETAYIYQDFRLLPRLTALENVAFVLQLLGQPEHKAKEHALSLLVDLGLESRIHHVPSQLSGGEQQRVALCRAFASPKQVIFADEPTGNLDKKSAEKVIETLFSLNQKYKTTLILVTHELALAKLTNFHLHLFEGTLGES